MKFSIKLTACLVLGFCAALSTVMASDNDLVIRNGRVMEPETGHDAVADAGVRDGRIAVITGESISGDQTIEPASELQWRKLS